MEELIQKTNELLNRIQVVLEKLSKIEDNSSFDDRNRITLILSNLSSSLNNCDDKLLLKPILDVIATNLTQIESNVNSKHYNVVQSYLSELVKTIAFLNNANGKHNLQGYQSAVKSNIRILENDVKKSREKLDELKTLIDEEVESFEKSESSIIKSISEHQKEFEQKIVTLNTQYESFSSDAIKKQEEIQTKMLEEQQKFKKEYSEELLALKEDVTNTKLAFKNDASKELLQFNTEKTEKFEILAEQVSQFIDETGTRIEELEISATEKIGFVASATHSNVYKTYSDRAGKESTTWYKGTVLSMIALVGLSIWWFVFTKYENTEYIALIARICATVGVAVISRYCAIQASKAKVVETKLRKIQLQMATFDAFVASLDKDAQDELKIRLTNQLIDQKDWLSHDKNEINIIKDFEKLIGKIGYKVELNKDDDDNK